ncbi:hypothetical protein GCG54_00008120 [Colletotrichum gloeosporioides]|uniref:Uncharacterized protein n=1 Tax=Colletotrichum gloeosporioides TaxID=474922 RepID=A0A8H4CMH0_COLGL|nr:uncharacterized protein GCG54_00008120 [Colletotrichum gloeosporioides]KAF3806605.1 hypothetical protein GCG54_00008120 [Colletotrichum gloeosporioides]
MALQASLAATSQPRILASYDDLTDHEKRSCDPILNHLLTLNRTGKALDDVTRKAFWDAVFQRWTTCPSAHNPLPHFRPREDSGTPVATLKQDAPVKTKNPSNAPMPPNRLQGATVWLQPVPNFITQQITYKWTDGANQKVLRSVATLLPELSWTQARIEAIIKRDHKELDRVGHLNMSVAVYYARAQLLSHLKLNRRDGSRKGHKRCKACKTHEVSDMKEFQEIRLCGDFILAHKDLSAGYFAHEKQPLVGPSFM